MELYKGLDISHMSFVRTTDPSHYQDLEKIWRQFSAQCDIYLNTFKGHYCLGCKKFKGEIDFDDG